MRRAAHRLSRRGSSSCTPACTSWACICGSSSSSSSGRDECHAAQSTPRAASTDCTVSGRRRCMDLQGDLHGCRHPLVLADNSDTRQRLLAALPVVGLFWRHLPSATTACSPPGKEPPAGPLRGGAAAGAGAEWYGQQHAQAERENALPLAFSPVVQSASASRKRGLAAKKSLACPTTAQGPYAAWALAQGGGG